jgi:hypothetical protein
MYSLGGRKRVIDVLMERIRVSDGQEGGNVGPARAS